MQFIQACKTFLATENGKKLVYEVKSAVTTFVAIFIGTLAVNPLINALINTDLPTIEQFKDLVPVCIDALYRSSWIFILYKVGLRNLSHRNLGGN